MCSIDKCPIMFLIETIFSRLDRSKTWDTLQRRIVDKQVGMTVASLVVALASVVAFAVALAAALAFALAWAWAVALVVAS